MREIRMIDLQSQYLRLKARMDAAISEVLQSGQFIGGNRVKDLEKALSERFAVADTITCGNGTDAIKIALLALDLPPGAEVITAGFGYASVAEMSLILGFKPVYCDVHADTGLMDPESVKRLINPRTACIVPVHLFGQVCDMEPIMQLAESHGIKVLEDNAQSLGATYRFSTGEVRYAGSIGHISTTSFFPTKNLGCYGDGGAVMTNDPQLAAQARMIANHGQTAKYRHQVIGMNSRLDALQAAVLRVKLEELDQFEAERNHVAATYRQRLEGINGLYLPGMAAGSSHVNNQYTLRVADEETRDRMKQHLSDKGIPTAIYYPMPLYRQEAYRQDISLPVTELLCRTVLSLPMGTDMDDDQLSYICAEVRSFFNHS